MNTDAATVTQMVNIYSVPAHDTVSFICSAGLSLSCHPPGSESTLLMRFPLLTALAEARGYGKS